MSIIWLCNNLAVSMFAAACTSMSCPSALVNGVTKAAMSVIRENVN